MEILLFSANAVLPIILLTLLGYFLRQKGFLTPQFLSVGNKVVFYICLPVMMFYNLYNIKSFQNLNWGIVVFSMLITVLIILLGVLFAQIFVKDKASRGTIVQCIFRSNYSVIGLQLAGALGGTEAAAIGSLILAAVLPLYNVWAIIVLSAYGPRDRSQHAGFLSLLLKIARNPQVIMLVVALVVLGIRSQIPLDINGEPIFSIQKSLPFLYAILENINKATAFLSLLVLGGTLEFRGMEGRLPYIVYGTVGRTCAAPLIGILCTHFLSSIGLVRTGRVEYAALIALYASPVAFSSAIMAQEMGCDGDLARQLVLWTSILSSVSLFVIISICKAIGIL